MVACLSLSLIIGLDMRLLKGSSIIPATPERLLLSMTFLMSFGFGTWQVLLNNFAIDRAAFTGVEIGILQSLREIPGFLAFTAVFLLMFVREQRFALLALLCMFTGIALTGALPTALGLYVTTVLMSLGFHYFETINKSLTLQWLSKEKAPEFLGQALSIKAIAALTAYALIWLAMGQLNVDYIWMYALIGGLGFLVTACILVKAPDFSQGVDQHKKLILRRRYSLYYLLVFLSGARRQIFVVFAGFMMVEKFGYTVADISALFIVNYVFNFFFAKKIGAYIGRFGERRTLITEYLGLIFVFTGYAFVSNAHLAAGLYVIDHMFFALSIAVSTYFQKIADKKDMASSASVSFTINHIAAVCIPVLLGSVWMYSTEAVFLTGVGFAAASLFLSFCIPNDPSGGNEWRLPFAGQSRTAQG